jgi:primosomal protein DnaI
MKELKQPGIASQYTPDPEEKKKLAEELRRDRIIHRLMKLEGIPETELVRSAYTFKRYREEIEPCVSCQSLSDCGQKKKGYHPGLFYDGILHERIESCRYQQEQEKRTAHLANYLVSDLAKEFETVSFDEIDLSSETKEYVKAVVTASDLCFEEQGAYLYGNMGTGKTYLAACAANYVTRSGKKAAFIHCPAFFERAMNTYLSGEYKIEADRCRFADLLVVDDIGAEAVSERGRMILLAILDARMQNHRMTWFTSNDDFEMLRNHLRYTSRGEDTAAADRIIERIRALAKPVFLPGDDRRPLFGA